VNNKQLRKELMDKFPNMIRRVANGVGSCRGYIDVCCAVYGDAHKTFKCEMVRDYLKQAYPSQKFLVY